MSFEYIIIPNDNAYIICITQIITEYWLMQYV